MALIKYCCSFVIIVATATILLPEIAQAAGGDICLQADYVELCRSVVKGQSDPAIATGMNIDKLVEESKQAKAIASRAGKDQNVEVCVEQFDDAVDNLNTAKGYLQAHDIGSLNVELSAALTDYVTCDDAFAEAGQTAPFKKATFRLRRLASNSLYLASLIH